MAQDFDVALKLLFDKKDAQIVRGLAGEPIARWLSSELPEIRNQRADLIGETESGQYYAAIYRKCRSHPIQVGMPAHFSTPSMKHRYRVVDLRTLDGEAYLHSGAADAVPKQVSRHPARSRRGIRFADPKTLREAFDATE